MKDRINKHRIIYLQFSKTIDFLPFIIKKKKVEYNKSYTKAYSFKEYKIIFLFIIFVIESKRILDDDD